MINNAERRVFCCYCGSELDGFYEKNCSVCGYNIFETESFEKDLYFEDGFLEESLED